jgi:hypothetical protein
MIRLQIAFGYAVCLFLNKKENGAKCKSNFDPYVEAKTT